MKMYTTIMTRFGDAKQCEHCGTWMMWPQEYKSIFNWDEGEDLSILEVCYECAKEFTPDWGSEGLI